MLTDQGCQTHAVVDLEGSKSAKELFFARLMQDIGHAVFRPEIWHCAVAILQGSCDHLDNYFKIPLRNHRHTIEAYFQLTLQHLLHS